MHDKDLGEPGLSSVRFRGGESWSSRRSSLLIDASSPHGLDNDIPLRTRQELLQRASEREREGERGKERERTRSSSSRRPLLRGGSSEYPHSSGSCCRSSMRERRRFSMKQTCISMMPSCGPRHTRHITQLYIHFPPLLSVGGIGMRRLR